MKVSRPTLFALRLAPLLLVLAGWEVVVRVRPDLAFFFGSPSRIALLLARRGRDGSLAVDLGVTLSEAAVGFVLGNLVGTLAGLGLWYSRTAFEVSRPYIIALGSAPLIALAPLLVVWFGTGFFSKVMVATLSTVFVALHQSYMGVSEVSGDHLRLMTSFGATKHQVFRKVVVPSAVVWVLSAFRLNVGFALLGAFVGEFISSSRGLGHLILVASGLFDISLVLCGVITFVAIALASNLVITRLEGVIRRAVAGIR